MIRRSRCTALAFVVAAFAVGSWTGVAAMAAEAPAAQQANLFKPLNAWGPWVLEINGDGKGAMWAIDQTLLIITSGSSTENWHVQCFYADLELKEGQEYVVKFQAKSPESAQVALTATLNKDPWNELGLHEDLALTPEYQPFEFTFKATGVSGKANRLGFAAGVTKGIVYVKDLSLTAKS